MDGHDVSWETAAQDFRRDGGLRDIYVLDATLADWQAAFDRVRVTYDPIRFTIDGEPATLPPSVTEIFPIWERASPALQFEVGGVEVMCHFFASDEIEFDLWPQDVTGPERLDAVAAFMRELASAVGKPAVLTMENMREAVILRADPVTKRVVWVPPSDSPAG
jgi:hypothetical protein